MSSCIFQICWKTGCRN